MKPKFAAVVMENYHAPECFYLRQGHEKNEHILNALAHQARFDKDEKMAQQFESGDLGPLTYYDNVVELPENAVFAKYKRNGKLWYWMDESGEKQWGD